MSPRAIAMQEWMWWAIYLCFVVLIAQLESLQRRLRVIEAKLAATLRRIGGDPTAVEEELQTTDSASEAARRQLAKRAVPLGFVLLLVGGIFGALVGWLCLSLDAAFAGGAVGALLGFALGMFLHGVREGMR